MRWTIHGERSVHESPWMVLSLVDVEPPGAERFEHHVLRIPRAAAGTVIWDAEREAVLLLWRHRFVTDRWGWEIPAGVLDPGETPEQAAAREALEESGWRPIGLEPLAAYNPMPGGVDQTFHLFLALGAEAVGAPSDPTESESVDWVPVSVVREALDDGRIVEGMTFTALSYALASGRLPPA